MDAKVEINSIEGLAVLLNNMEEFSNIEFHGHLWDLIYIRGYNTLKHIPRLQTFELLLDHPIIYDEILDTFNSLLITYVKHNINLKDAKVFIDIMLPKMYNIMAHENYQLDEVIVDYYTATQDPKVLAFILHYIQNWEYEDKETFLNTIYELDKDLWNKIITTLPDPTIYMDEELKRKYKQDMVIDTAIAFKGSVLPPYVVEEIINHAYDTRSTLEFHDVMSKIAPILEFQRDEPTASTTSKSATTTKK